MRARLDENDWLMIALYVAYSRVNTTQILGVFLALFHIHYTDRKVDINESTKVSTSVESFNEHFEIYIR